MSNEYLLLEPVPPNRQPGRFAGFSLYVSDIDLSSASDIKRSTMCYKEGPQLPPLNFTTVCKVYGRYVIYYNERFNDVIYPLGYETVNVFTELCEVVVKGKMYIVLSMNKKKLEMTNTRTYLLTWSSPKEIKS